MLLISIVFATLLGAVGFLVIAVSMKAEGGLKSLGIYIGGWTMGLAVLLILGAATAPLFGGLPFGLSHRSMMYGMMDRSTMHGGGMGSQMRPQQPPAP
jgi:hypothetical protein